MATRTFAIVRKPKRKRQAPEADLQKQLFQALAVLLPDNCFVTHFPLGGGGQAHGFRMKALGTVAGAPDIWVCFQGRLLCIELKSPEGDLSPEQRHAHDRIRAAGGHVEIARSLNAALGHLRSFGVKLKDAPVGGLENVLG